jgi:hypothetical protein
MTLLVDKDILRPHISNFGVDFLKVVSSSDQRVEQVPDFWLLEVTIDSLSVFNLLSEDILVVIEVNLHYNI